jgi:hypothetical protein
MRQANLMSIKGKTFCKQSTEENIQTSEGMRGREGITGGWIVMLDGNA